MLDLDEATDVIWLSTSVSWSGSSDSIEPWDNVEAPPVVLRSALDSDRPVFRGSLLRPWSEDSCRNCSKKDIWLLGRLPRTEIELQKWYN